MTEFRCFDVFRDGKVYLLVQNCHPGISLRIDTTNGMAELKELAVPDDCTAKDVLNVLSEMELFIKDLDL